MGMRGVAALIDEYRREYSNWVPGVRDGDAESVHQARIATRRMREVLPLVRGPRADGDSIEDVVDVARRTTRALGRVRELDVNASLLDELNTRVPSAGAALGVARAAIAERQERARRKLVKKLEKLDLMTRLEEADGFAPARSRFPGFSRGDEWTTRLRQRIEQRATDLEAAVEHAGGLYFPRRMHEVRIAAKKLRYSLEAAERLNLWSPPRLLRDLKRVQTTLGFLHDAQVLIEMLSSLVRDGFATERQALEDVLRAEIHRQHAEYLRRRDRLHAIVAACRRFARPRQLRRIATPALVAASAVAVPGIAMLLLPSATGESGRPAPRAFPRALPNPAI